MEYITQLNFVMMDGKSGQLQASMLNTHDIFIFIHIPIAIVLTSLNVGHYIICFLFLVESLWIALGDTRFTKSKLSRSYVLDCVVSALLSFYHTSVFATGYNLHILTKATLPLYVLHRRYPKNELYEWIYIFSWVICKLVFPLISMVDYMVMAGKLYSDWIDQESITPLYNPWTSPPAFLMTGLAVLSTLVNMYQTYYHIGKNKTLI